MLTNASNEFVRRYTERVSPETRSDLLEIIDIMNAVSPDAELVSDLGIPYFQWDSNWLYGAAIRDDNLYVYVSDPHILFAFEQRLRRAHVGGSCLIFHRLEDINPNVLVELLIQMKSHFEQQQAAGNTLIQ